MDTVPIRTTCGACQGRKFLETGETFITKGRTQNRLAKCQACDGTGLEVFWIDLKDFSKRLLKAVLAEIEQPSA